MERPETEFLVHIAAPAMAADDVKYRILAAAYLDFEPATGILLNAPQGKHVLKAAAWASSQMEESSQPALNPGVIDSPMLSFRSAADNLGSPRLWQPEKGNSQENQLSWQPPPSVVDDSMPHNDLAFSEYCTPSRILEHYTSELRSSQLDASPIPDRVQSQTLPPSTQTQKEGFAQASEGVKSRLLDRVSSDVIPYTPVGNRKRQRQATPTSSVLVEETRIESSYPSQTGEPAYSIRSESEPPLRKRPRTSQDPKPSKPMARSASDMGPQPLRAKAHIPGNHISGSLEILSPPPLTGQRQLRPEDMVTDVLARLARELKLEKRFKPVSQTRELRPFERGYWLLDCSSWDPDLKRSAWEFLTTYLGKGAAGWGVSCRRDRDFSRIRLYCWGCVIGHMYLVLYLASKRKVLYAGAQWVAGDGKEVVIMGRRMAPA